MTREGSPLPGDGGGFGAVLVRDPRYRVGGFETWVETLAAGLRAEGMPVHILVPSVSGTLPESAGGGWKVPIPATGDVESQAAAVLRALEHLAAEGRCGVYFTLGYRYVSVAGLHLGGSPWLPVPVVHGRNPADLDWILCGPPRRLVVPSRDHARILRRELGRRIGRLRALGRVRIIPHGVAIPPPQSLSGKWEHASDCLRIAVVSRLDEHAKRPWDVLNVAQGLAAARVPFRMRILGDGPCEAAMRTWVREQGLEAVVCMEGAVSREAVSACLASSHVLLSTSESEAFGLSIAEALAHACAVVSSDIPGPVSEMVNPRTGIRVPVGDIAGFCRALAGLQADGDDLARKGRAGRDYLERHYPLKRMVAGYRDFLREVRGFVRADPDWRAPRRLHATPGDALTARAAHGGWLRRAVRGWRASSRRSGRRF